MAKSAGEGEDGDDNGMVRDPSPGNGYCEDVRVHHVLNGALIAIIEMCGDENGLNDSAYLA